MSSINYNVKLADGSSSFNSSAIVQQAYSIANAPYVNTSNNTAATGASVDPNNPNYNANLYNFDQLMSQYSSTGVSGLDTTA